MNNIIYHNTLIKLYNDINKIAKLYNISKLDKALKDEDNNSWYMASHALKGSSASIGAFPLSRILEVSQKSSDFDSDKKIEIFLQVKEEFRKVEDYILKRLKS